MTLADPGRFEMFGTSHWAMLLLFALGTVPAARLGRRARESGREVPVGRVYALLVLGVTVPLQVLDFLPGSFDLQSTLPLQLCDMALVATVVALWTRHRVAVALSYYWGLSLTTQALVTPWLVRDFPDPKYLGFWAMHLLVVWAAIFLTWGLRIRPSWRTYATTVVITLGWMVAVFCFNVAAGTNYGFVNERPSTTSVLDLFGPWPWYLLVEVGIVSVLWALMTWPWTRSGPVAAR